MSTRRIVVALTIFILGAFLAHSSAWAQSPKGQSNGKRFALVMGNQSYTSGPLDNPGNDANVVGEVLRQLGFQVVRKVDLKREGMHKELEALADRSKGAEAALVYFSGHGVQENGKNFLLPIDANLEERRSIPAVTVSLDRAMKTVEGAGAQVNIFILDACRNAPFEDGRPRTSVVGLGQVKPGRGTLIAFSTSPGGVASDGKGGGNSAFTAALASSLSERNVGAESVFKRVREMVSARSNGKQVPWLNSGLIGEFIFNKGNEVKIPELPLAATSSDGVERKRAASSTYAKSDRWHEIKSPEDWAQLDWDIDQRAKRVTVDDLSELAGRAYDREAKAQVMLGDAYQIGIRSGTGWIRSNQDAMLWYRRAAAQGYPLAQVRIGEMYGESRGVDRDLVEAKRWFALAAAQGLQRAKVNLMQANLLGSGVLPSGGEMLDMIKGLTPQANTKNKAGSN